MNTETLDVRMTEQPELVQENGKRKRVMTDKQLKALEEGRKKRWFEQTTSERRTTYFYFRGSRRVYRDTHLIE